MSWPRINTYRILLDSNFLSIIVESAALSLAMVTWEKSSFTQLILIWLSSVLLIFYEGLEIAHQFSCGCIYCKDAGLLAASLRKMDFLHKLDSQANCRNMG
jgi:hypothetical protein